MWQMWKEVLLPGRQRAADGTWFTVTPADIRRAQANAAKMLSRGVPVPCIWEHLNVEAGDPEEWRAKYAKHTFAHVGGARLNGRGALELLHEGRDDRDRDQLLKTRFVSPKLYPSYSDSRGGEYRGATIAHVAATPTPVQTWQRPFELSRANALYLSYLPEGDMPEPKKDDLPAGGAGKSTLADVIQALRDTGMNIPDEVTDEAGLVIAIKAGGASGGDDDDLDGDGLPDVDGAGATAGGGGPPMLMSMTDPTARKWAVDERKDMAARIRQAFATGRIDRPTAKQMLRQAGVVEMSFTRDAEPICPLLKKIADAEAKPEWSAWSPTTRQDGTSLSTTRVPAPDKLTGGGGQAEAADDAVERACRIAGQPVPTKK
jgi:hypothetical protein